jgi:hypothetical protein
MGHEEGVGKLKFGKAKKLKEKREGVYHERHERHEKRRAHAEYAEDLIAWPLFRIRCSRIRRSLSADFA